MKSSFESMWQSSCILLRIRLLLTGSSSIQLAVVDSLTYNKEVSSLSLS